MGRLQHEVYGRGRFIPRVVALNEPVDAVFVPFVMPVPAGNHGYSLCVLIWFSVQYSFWGLWGGLGLLWVLGCLRSSLRSDLIFTVKSNLRTVYVGNALHAFQ